MTPQGIHPESLNRLEQERRGTISIAYIQTAVAEHYGLNPIEMVSDRRGWKVARPRQVAMFLARELTPFSLPVIGKHFGGRDHTTVMHGCNKVEERISKHGPTRTAVNRLRVIVAERCR